MSPLPPRTCDPSGVASKDLWELTAERQSGGRLISPAAYVGRSMNDLLLNANLHAKNVAWNNFFGAASLVFKQALSQLPTIVAC